MDQRRPPPPPPPHPISRTSPQSAPRAYTSPRTSFIRQTFPSETARAAPQGAHGARPPAQRLDHGLFPKPGRNQSDQRYAPTPNGRFRDESRSRYNINMNSRPPIADTPQFGSGNLRPRTNFPKNPMNDNLKSSDLGRFSQQTQPLKPPPVRSLGQDELTKLLQDNSTTRRAPPRFVQDVKSRKCFNCGEEGHESLYCPKMRHNRIQEAPAPSQWAPQRDYIAQHTKETFSPKEETRQAAAQLQERVVGTDIDFSDGMRRKRNQFTEEVLPSRHRNQYEEPQRRRRDDAKLKPRRRVATSRQEDEEDFDREERQRLRDIRKAAKAARKSEKVQKLSTVHIPEYVSVANLASMLKQRLDNFIRKLEDLGFEEVQHDHILNAEHAGLIAQEYNFDPIFQDDGSDGDLYPAPALPAEEYAQLPPRPPVVTIMGHVDHGKTTILDYIRKTSVAAGEFGGITQHIGAFSVSLGSGKNITFLDTPGHAAFETMRARGANVTDIVVLVVAADDSIMPQTVEAIKHAQAAKVPIIVAINKIDKQHANAEKVKLDLGGHGIEIEDFGGDVQTVLVSGKTGKGITDLEEAITLQSEVLDHRANPAAKVEGWVLEGSTKSRGRVATVLVRQGTLRIGDSLVAGNTWARVRSLRNEDGVMMKEVGPGMPVEVDGWREQPIAGDEVLQAEDEQQATSVADLRTEKLERQQLAKDMEAINQSRRLEAERREAEDAAGRAEAGSEDGATDPAVPEKKEVGPELVNFIIKGDVSGSVEAVIDSLVAIGNSEVGTRILRHGVGSPSEFDVQHAADAKGYIVNFNTAIPPHIAALAEASGVKILDSNIIYRVKENVKELLSQRLSPKISHKVVGEVDVAAIFEISIGGKKKIKIAGSKVRNGVVDKGARAKLLRKDEVIFDGVINSLKNVKKDVDQMRKDTECGIGFEGFEEFKVGDKIQCYEEIREKRYL